MANRSVVVPRPGTLCVSKRSPRQPAPEGCFSTPVAFLEGWYVDPDVRREGLGAALVRAAEDWARARGLEELASDTTIDNVVSLKAHLALGFEEVERQICFRKTL